MINATERVSLLQKRFIEVINRWKAERLDTDALVKYFKSMGARYVVVHVNHHDHYDNFDSSHHPWNSVKTGPHKDIVGLFEKSARKYGLRFGVSSHDDRMLRWWLPAFDADKSGPYKGIPYEGRMTKADGKGKWWEGLDPAQLYGLPPEQRIIINKNGNMLLNVELMPDGTIDPSHKGILDDVGRWVVMNEKNIYASKPWKVYGDNLNSCLREIERNIVNADAKEVMQNAQKENFNARTVASSPYGHDEVRFTVHGKELYVFVLNPVPGSTIRLPALGLGSEQKPGRVKSVKMLGGGKVAFSQDSRSLALTMPEKLPTPYATVFEVKGALQ